MRLPLLFSWILLFLVALPSYGEPSTLAKLRQEAASGDNEARFQLGQSLATGEEDLEEAARWFREAALDGHTLAQLEWGRALSEGRGVAQNSVEAARWYLSAAEQGCAKADYLLAAVYVKGDGVPQDRALAIQHLQRAAEAGYAPAQIDLAKQYLHGRGEVQQDRKRALRWLKRASDSGSPEGQYRYGSFLLGSSDAKLRAEGDDLLHRSASSGYVPAQKALKPPPKAESTWSTIFLTVVATLVATAVCVVVYLWAAAWGRGLRESFTSRVLPSRREKFDDVVVGSSFKLSVEFDVNSLNRLPVSGVLRDHGREVKIDSDHPPSIVRALLGHYCGGHVAHARAILTGEREGRPLQMRSVAECFEARFSWDCGPSMDTYNLRYNPQTRTLTGSSTMEATSWE